MQHKLLTADFCIVMPGTFAVSLIQIDWTGIRNGPCVVSMQRHILSQFMLSQGVALAHVLALPSCAGLELDPSNAQLKDGLESVTRAQSNGTGGGGGLGGLFGPEFMARLAMNPQVRLRSTCSVHARPPSALQPRSYLNAGSRSCRASLSSQSDPRLRFYTGPLTDRAMLLSV